MKKKNTFSQILGKNQYEQTLQAGDIRMVQINALGAKNFGIAELKNGYTILVPNTKCGEKVQVKIEKIFATGAGKLSTAANQQIKYAVATIHKEKEQEKRQINVYGKTNFDLKVGQKLKVTILKKGPKNSGLVPISKNFLLIIPNTNVGDKVVVEIQKIKSNYAFANISQNLVNINNNTNNTNVHTFAYGFTTNGAALHSHLHPATSVLSGANVQMQQNNSAFAPNAPKEHAVLKTNYSTEKIIERGETDGMINRQFHIVIPPSAKTFSNYFVVKFNGNLLFIKKNLGVQFGDLVKIQIQKKTTNFIVAKILQIQPISNQENKIMVKQNLQKMIQSSMHFGEKAIRCNANMRKYIWHRIGARLVRGGAKMQNSLIKNQASFQRKKKQEVNLGIKPLIKRGRHILNLLKTQRCLNQALKQLAKYAAKGKTFLFVGTKKPAASLIAKTALLSHTSFFVNTRWLGGMLTNWKTILKSISQIRPILKQKQKILQKILEKRQKIQRRLFNKVYVLRKKSQKFMIKAKYLIRQISSYFPNNYFGFEKKAGEFFIEKSQKFMQQKNTILFTNLTLLNASKNLKRKKIQIFKQIQQFEMAVIEISKQKQQIQSLISTNIAKFQEFEQFFSIGQEFLQIQKTFEKNDQISFIPETTHKYQNKIDKDQKFVQNPLENIGANIPTPSPEIFQKMISVLFYLSTTNATINSSSKLGLAKEIQKNAPIHFFDSNKNNSNRSKNNLNEKISEPNPQFYEKVDLKQKEVESQKKKIILLSQFFNKFLIFLPLLKNSMENLSFRLIEFQKMLIEFDFHFQKIVKSQQIFKELSQKISNQLSVVFAKFVIQKHNFQKFQTNFQQFAAEQRLLKFLPKLRYLPASADKMYETVELFMKKFVDPKFTYPMEQIYDQKLKFTSKKIAAIRKQKWQRLEKYFGGITKMAKMNTKQISKNVAIIVGQQEEMNDVHECKKLGMKIFAIVDTNCNPKYVDHFIPANDDSRNSIKFILGEMLTYIRLGQKLRKKITFSTLLKNSQKI